MNQWITKAAADFRVRMGGAGREQWYYIAREQAAGHVNIPPRPTSYPTALLIGRREAMVTIADSKDHLRPFVSVVPTRRPGGSWNYDKPIGLVSEMLTLGDDGVCLVVGETASHAIRMNSLICHSKTGLTGMFIGLSSMSQDAIMDCTRRLVLPMSVTDPDQVLYAKKWGNP